MSLRNEFAVLSSASTENLCRWYTNAALFNANLVPEARSVAHVAFCSSACSTHPKRAARCGNLHHMLRSISRMARLMCLPITSLKFAQST